MSAASDPVRPEGWRYEQRLEGIRLRYSNKRSTNWKLVNECIDVALEARYEYEAWADARVNSATAAAEAERDSWAERLERLTTENRQLREKLEDRHQVIEERSQATAEDAEVKFGNQARDWSIAELEEIAYRIRIAGGDDRTRVRVNEFHAIARVPFPNALRVDLPLPEPARPDPGGLAPGSYGIEGPGGRGAGPLARAIGAFPGPRWLAWPALGLCLFGWVSIAAHLLG